MKFEPIAQYRLRRKLSLSKKVAELVVSTVPIRDIFGSQTAPVNTTKAITAASNEYLIFLKTVSNCLNNILTTFHCERLRLAVELIELVEHR